MTPDPAPRPAGEDVVPGFRAFVTRTFGADGEQWLASLPGRIADAAARWELILGDELPGGVLSQVRLVTTKSGMPAVLKVAAWWDRPADEVVCLERWAGDGAPRLLAADLEHGQLLLERIEPGTAATDADTAEVAELIRALHVEPPDGMRELEEVALRRLARAVAQRGIPADRAAREAERVVALTGSSTVPVLLHGDLDERNILRCSRRGLAAIDPLPCIGDPAYDAATWAHANGRPGRRERQREIAAALGLDPMRVRQWGAIVATHG